VIIPKSVHNLQKSAFINLRQRFVEEINSKEKNIMKNKLKIVLTDIGYSFRGIFSVFLS